MVPVIQTTLPTDDIEFVEIVSEFIDRLHRKLESMDEAWRNKDLDQLARLAHWLKGSGGTAGFRVLTEPAVKLERLAQDERVDKIDGALGDIHDLVARIERPVLEPDPQT